MKSLKSKLKKFYQNTVADDKYFMVCMKQIHWFEAKEKRFERDALGGIN